MATGGAAGVTAVSDGGFLFTDPAHNQVLINERTYQAEHIGAALTRFGANGKCSVNCPAVLENAEPLEQSPL